MSGVGATVAQHAGHASRRPASGLAPPAARISGGGHHYSLDNAMRWTENPRIRRHPLILP